MMVREPRRCSGGSIAAVMKTTELLFNGSPIFRRERDMPEIWSWFGELYPDMSFSFHHLPYMNDAARLTLCSLAILDSQGRLLGR